MRTSKKIKISSTQYRQEAGAVGLAVGMLTLSGAAYADDPIKRLLDLQLKKGIITQEERAHLDKMADNLGFDRGLRPGSRCRR